MLNMNKKVLNVSRATAPSRVRAMAVRSDAQKPLKIGINGKCLVDEVARLGNFHFAPIGQHSRALWRTSD